VKEPTGGAHRDPQTAIKNLKAALIAQLRELSAIDPGTLVEARYMKFRQMGVYSEPKK
jgi:acetyl-CoA carboxylase carboxyl transferase subunit alpha